MSHLKAILAILSPAERRGALRLLGLMFVGMIAETLGIGLVVPAIALFMQENIGATYPMLTSLLGFLGSPSKTQLIAGGMLVFVLVYLFKNLFLGYLAWKQNKFNTEVLVNLSRRLFTLYLRQPYAFHLQRNSSELIRNIVNEVGYFLGTGLNSAMILITEGLVLAGIVILLVIMEPVGAIGLFLTIGVAGFSFQRLNRNRVSRWGKIRQSHDGLRIKQVQQGLGGVKDVLLLGRETDFLNQYDIHNRAQAEASLKMSVLQAMPRLWLEVMAVTSIAVLVLLMIAQGRGTEVIIPVLALFGAAAFRLLPSIGKILSAAQSVRFGDSVLEMLKSELRLELPPDRPSQDRQRMAGNIELLNISFTYAGATTTALNNVSLAIHEGETVGFIGPSGSGKSSLVDVILGLLQPESGEVRVNTKPIRENLRGWQDQIGYVPQAIFLTDDTLRRNIAFGLHDDKIDDASVTRAIQSARLAEFIQSLPEGLETVVGERGIRLSGGQRQRIGIARALYHDPEVIVLDEATSALDGSTESEVMDAIDALKGSKTVIIVAHRLSTVENCDRIFRLEAGKLMETGTPAEILRKSNGSSSRPPLDLGVTA
jgi:ABC-type multidrug transport system fused ATPase/permease subunit